MNVFQANRRHLLGASLLPVLVGVVGCSSPLPLDVRPTPPDAAGTAGSSEARARLMASAQAHGLEAFRRLRDINIGYEGEWRPLIDRIQPEVVDARFRGSSQERILVREHVQAQLYRGPAGAKKVLWQRDSGRSEQAGAIAVWRNGQPDTSPPALDAAALVAEGYLLFLLGPLWLADRSLALRMAGTERVDGRECEVVEGWLSPGLGRAPTDRIALCIDRKDALMRRVRFTLEGFSNTKGAVAEVDTFDHQQHFGVTWPMRSFERVLHPVALPAHDWRIVGLDVNRGYGPEALRGPAFEGAAAAPARALPKAPA